MKPEDTTVYEDISLNTFLKNKGYTAIKIHQNFAGHLLVDVTLNGHDTQFILDTGASATVLDLQQAEKLQLELQHGGIEYTAAGAGGLGLAVTPSKGNTIQIGDRVFADITLSVMSLEHVNEAFAQLNIQEIFTGVIGVDILKPGKAIIDVGNMMLYLA